MRRARRLTVAAVAGGAISLLPAAAVMAAEEETTAAAVQAALDNIWVLTAGVLVFFMQAGFALVEAGLTRAKNVVNIFAKNLSDALVGMLAFFAVGYAFAFGSEGSGFERLIGTEGFFLSGIDLFSFDEGLSGATFWFFQAVFCATAVTIASGAMAERTKFSTYLIFSAVMTGFIYPVVVHWTWGGGMIANMKIGDAVYTDFAGSGVVHLSGGVAALMGAALLGPRIGKYGPDGKPRAIPGHNIPFALIGVFILWLGWFGFNPGSELAADSWVPFVAMNTMLAGAAGGFVSMMVIWWKAGKPDLSMVGNGVLAGLVGITAGCGSVNSLGSVVIGAVAGVIVVFSVFFFDRIKIDDPVGAVSVHGICGIWGVLAVGLFARYDDAFLGREEAGLFYGGGIDQLIMQLVMVLIIIAWVGVSSFILFQILKRTIGLRVSREEELEGLDILEHAQHGYVFEDTVPVDGASKPVMERSAP